MAQGQHVHAEAVDLDFELIGAIVVSHHGPRRVAVARDERMHRTLQGGLRLAAECEQAAAEQVQVIV
jgi:hypothetical protein